MAKVKFPSSFLKDRRGRLGLESVEVANKIGVSPEAYRQIEHRGELPENHFPRLADALHASKMAVSETTLFELGMAYIDNNMHKESIDVFKKVLALNPNHVNANNNLGFAYGCVKEWDKGIKYCQIALGLSPDHQLAKNNLSWMRQERARENATGK